MSATRIQGDPMRAVVVTPANVAAALPADTAWRALLDEATEPYRQAGRFAWHFARGKLGRDPVFRSLIERNLIGDKRNRVLDIGCGQGLFASLLSAMSAMQRDGRWPVSWARTPASSSYVGIELMPRDVARAEQSLKMLSPKPRFICADMRTANLPKSDLVLIFDVLHYVDLAAQEAVLKRVKTALAGRRGRLLLRVGDASNKRGFAISQWVDRTVTRIRGHKVSPTWGRPLADWIALLQRLGFDNVQSMPMSTGTPFANVLLIADVGEPAARNTAKKR